MSLIRFQDVLRDGIQSLLGMNPSAQEIIDAYPLKNDGFSDSQVLSMQRKWSDNNIYNCIRDSVDKKAAGLYNFMITELNNYKFKINS
jgi:hypothetical protein